MHDRDVRIAVRQMLNTRYADDDATRIVEEMGVWSGSARIDIAVINGELCGYELKSDSDTLVRLPSQVKLYSNVFDRIILVAGTRHASKTLAMTPNWWGIVAASEFNGGVTLRSIRDPELNPSPNPYLVAQLLWKEEALRVLESLDAARGWRSRTARAIHEHLAQLLPFPELAARVRETLKQRPNWLGQSISDKGKMTIRADLDPGRPAT